jgi:hypothetical protein
MIQEGSMAVLRTKKASYKPCKIVKSGGKNVTVTFFAGIKKDRATGEYYEDRPVETIPFREIVSLTSCE